MAIVIACAITALACAACSKSPQPSASTTTSTKPAPTTTSTAALPVAPQPSASVAATALINAWATGNKPQALSVATASAVTTLFAVPYPGSGLAISRGCSDAFQPIICTFGPNGGANPNDSIYQVDVTQTPGGWYVSDVRVE